MPLPTDKTSTPGKRQSLQELKELQRLTASAIMRPLGRGWRTQRQWTDGRAASEVISQFIKPNQQLSSLDRLEIYNRQYWFRILDCIRDDFPGLEAVLGQKRCGQLFRAYLAKCPSQSYTLRDLGDRLAAFLVDEPRWAGSKQAVAVEMAQFEWAQVIAFDSEAMLPLKLDDLLGADPAKLQLKLQPHLSLMELHWPLDEFSIALKRREVRSDASNATGPGTPSNVHRRPRLPRPEHVFIAVHRADNAIYYKRLEPIAFKLLTALRDKETLGQACDIAFRDADEASIVAAGASIQKWFTNWAALGWFVQLD